MGRRLIITENEKNHISKMYGLINEQKSSEFKTNMPVRLKGTYDGETVTRDITIYLKYEPKFIPQRSASGELDFVWSYQNVAPRPADRMGSFNCGKEWVHLPDSEDVGEFYGKIYDDTALMMMKNYCKGGQNKQPDSTMAEGLVSEQPNSFMDTDPEIKTAVMKCAMQFFDKDDLTRIPNCLAAAMTFMSQNRIPDPFDPKDWSIMQKCASEIFALDKDYDDYLEFFNCIASKIKGTPISMN